MLSGFPLFPDAGSTLAADVDNLYLFILAITAFFAHRSSSSCVIYFAIKYRDRHRRQGWRADHRLDAARARLVDHPVPHLDRDLRLGVGRLLPPRRGRRIRRWRSTRPASGGCGGSSTSTASARSTSCTCRSGRPVKVTFTSEDVLHDLFIPGVPREGRRHSRPLQRDLVRRRRRSASITSSAPSTAARKHSGMIGTVFVMEPADYQAWLSGGGGHRGGSMADARRAAVHRSSACITCHLNDGSGRGPSLVGMFGSTVHARQRHDGRRRRKLPSRVDPDAAGEDSSPGTSR